ncbi:MAG: dihydroorotase [Acidobacteriales bacterium]|nr:dihydroorotase [Terriglobales bacterium]
MAALLIKNGHLIDPAAGIDRPMDMLIKDGRVARVAEPGALPSKDAKVLDARGLIVAPGFIDLHVHLREPGQSYKETIASGTAAAAAGGFTSVCCMPNAVPVVDSPEWVRWLRQPERGAVVNVFPIAAATVGSHGEQITAFVALKAAGAIAFSDDGRPVVRTEVMRDALAAAAKLGVPVIQHSEDPRLSHGCAINAGPTAFRLGLRGMPAEAESSMVERDLKLARETGGHLHVAHISTRKSLDAVRRAKRAGVRVTCEVTPHHFTLLDTHVGEYNTAFKMCPPLRSEDDREALIEGLLDGAIDCIATDHAPHAADEKAQEFERAPNGIIGLETAAGLALQVLHHHHKMPLKRMVELFSANPARIAGLKGRGTLAKGAHADITLFDSVRAWTYSAFDTRSKSRNTPFDGWQFTGQVVATVVNSELVFTAKDAKETQRKSKI